MRDTYQVRVHERSACGSDIVYDQTISGADALPLAISFALTVARRFDVTMPPAGWVEVVKKQDQPEEAAA